LVRGQQPAKLDELARQLRREPRTRIAHDAHHQGQRQRRRDAARQPSPSLEKAYHRLNQVGQHEANDEGQQRQEDGAAEHDEGGQHADPQQGAQVDGQPQPAPASSS
jgi:hypothetical protein